ncbi:hypothetical protein Pmani_016930 [Petrolisthes manimaculis]|uniref:C2H2-type domain-containing protein n=1 Tax=Petrolisthes manimaculis TaxID=1843537 RepID=A0AAE1U5X2_9EUCA|nr:hypothetical protein Pmani_016930 [Petrolisthes manimaculis]
MAPNAPETPVGDHGETEALLTTSTTDENHPPTETPTWPTPTAPPTPIARPPSHQDDCREGEEATGGGESSSDIPRSNSTAGRKFIRWVGVQSDSRDESEGEYNGDIPTPASPTIVVSTEGDDTTEVLHVNNETEARSSSPGPPPTPTSCCSDRQQPDKTSLNMNMSSLDLPDSRHPSFDYTAYRKTRRNSMNEVFQRMGGSQTNLQPSLLPLTNHHSLRRSSSRNSLDPSVLNWKQEGNDSLIAAISAVYGKLLVVMGMGIPVAQFITHEIPGSFYNGFYLYLYIGSIVFLVYAYMFLLQTVPLPSFNMKAKLRALKRMASGDCNVHESEADIESDPGSTTGYFRKHKYGLAENHGSMYLKMGAVLFGTGSMIYSGLEVGQYYEVQSRDESCTDTLLFISPAARMLFTFIQMYFIFLNSRATFSRHRIIARFGMMHMIGTNLCIWLNVLVQETEHEISHLLEHHDNDHHDSDHHDSDHHYDDSSAVLGNHDSTNAVPHVDHDSHHIEELMKMGNDSHNLVRRASGTNTCATSSLMQQPKDNASPFLFPCTIEYSLLCAGVLYIMWNNMNKPSVTSDHSSDISTIAAFKVRHHYSVDCAHANRGLFMGILILVLTILSLILFFVLINNVDYQAAAIIEANIIKLSIHGIALATVVIAMKQMRELEFLPEGDIELDNILLLIAETGVYIFTSFTIVGGLFAKSEHDFLVLPLVTAIITLAQTMLQTNFILDASRRCCYNEDQLERKPGREMVTFMLVCNLAMWALNTFETSRAAAHPAQMNFYGIEAWTIISHISMPLAIFYRFHVTVCLCEIWKSMNSEGKDGVCWVCVRGLAGGWGVKTTSHLRHSTRSISQALQDLTQKEADDTARLCFRCYRLVLGIDHHKLQLERQQQSFFDIYHSAHPFKSFTETDDRELKSDSVKCEVIENSDASIDCNSDIKASIDETLEQPGAPIISNIPSSSLEPRKKRAKKWVDYHYYDEEGKTGDTDNVECNDNTVTMEQYVNFNIANRKTRITCSACNQDFSTHRQFGRHDCQQSKWRGRRGKVTYTCKGCQVTFTMRRDYIRHIDDCYKNVPVTCDLCQVKLPSAAYLPRHLSSFHKSSTTIKKGSLCEQCGRGFSRKESLERHQATVHGVAHGSHQCPQCGKTFPHTAILAEHLRAHRGYPCLDCGNKRTFSCMSNLLLHRRTHHSTVHHSSGNLSTTHPFHCLPCNKRWKFHASYTYHMRKYHSGEDDSDRSEEIHRCPGCKLPLTSHKALLRHAQSCPANTTKDLTEGTPPVKTSINLLHQSNAGSKTEYRSLKNMQDGSGISGEKPRMAKITDSGPAKKILPGNKISRKQAIDRDLVIENSADDEEQVASACLPGETIIEERETIQDAIQFPLASESLPSPCSTTFTPTQPAPASEIILEALEDLSGDCQYVILVEDCLSDTPDSQK